MTKPAKPNYVLNPLSLHLAPTYFTTKLLQNLSLDLRADNTIEVLDNTSSARLIELAKPILI